MVTPEMLLWLAKYENLINPQIRGSGVYICRDDFPPIRYEPHKSDSQFGSTIIRAVQDGWGVDAAPGSIVVNPGPNNAGPVHEERHDSTPDSIRAAAVVAICRALGYQEQ